MSEKSKKDIHEAYLNCKEVFKPSFNFAEQIMEIEDENERAFYELLYNYFLQQNQKEVIAKGVY